MKKQQLRHLCGDIPADQQMQTRLPNGALIMATRNEYNLPNFVLRFCIGHAAVIVMGSGNWSRPTGFRSTAFDTRFFSHQPCLYRAPGNK